MINIHAQSVSHGLYEALWIIKAAGVEESSRNGSVLVFPTPVTTTYHNPGNRVLFSPMRNANPFFHLMEALWMLAGRNDLAYPEYFNKRFKEYSDDGKTIWGAYGWRWRSFFQYDQLKSIISELRKNPNSRRCVLSMWNAMPVDGERDPHSGVFLEGEVDYASDLAVARSGGKDVPCNTHAYFDLRGGRLNMTVCNRSNDMIWGCYGANAVHFSVLLEYMAVSIGVPMGVYRQMSNNLHLYTDVVPINDIVNLANDLEGTDLYRNHVEGTNDYGPTNVVDCEVDLWEKDLHRFLRRDGLPNKFGWNSEFFQHTARPMYFAFEAWREKRYMEAAGHAEMINAWDWRRACVEWLERQAVRRKEKDNA